MPHLIKPKFEQARHEALRLKPMREAEVAAIQANIVDLLNSIGDILVERARRPNHTDPLVEINCSWIGPASNHRDVMEILRENWPSQVFGELHNNFHIEVVDEKVLLRFVATDDQKYLTGKLSVRT